jgi:hypothetical protein
MVAWPHEKAHYTPSSVTPNTRLKTGRVGYALMEFGNGIRCYGNPKTTKRDEAAGFLMEAAGKAPAVLQWITARPARQL